MLAYGEVKAFEILKLDKYLAKSIIILISGKAGVGKSYVSDKLRILLDDKGYDVEIKNLAGGVKQCAYEFFNWNGNKDEKGRKLLQNIGNIGREYNNDLWVEYLIKNIEDSLFYSDVYIIDDWRFPNEKDYIENLKSFYTFTIRVESKYRGDYSDKDVSEQSLPVFQLDSDGGSCPKNYYDFVIDNSYVDKKLEETLITILEAIDKMEINNE
jgi:hypothetical protein